MQQDFQISYGYRGVGNHGPVNHFVESVDPLTFITIPILLQTLYLVIIIQMLFCNLCNLLYYCNQCTVESIIFS